MPFFRGDQAKQLFRLADNRFGDGNFAFLQYGLTQKFIRLIPAGSRHRMVRFVVVDGADAAQVCKMQDRDGSVLGGLAFSKSSSVMVTYLPFSNAKLLIMSCVASGCI